MPAPIPTPAPSTSCTTPSSASHYARIELGCAEPRVGLLTIGTEEGKGNALIAETHDALKRIGPLVNYVGPVEGFQLFSNQVDVVVCDGFVGNICIKSWESLAQVFHERTARPPAEEPLPRRRGVPGARRVCRPAPADQSRALRGAPLLGVKGNIIKTHGSSNRQSWKNAIRVARDAIQYDLNRRIEADVARANELLSQPVA